VNVPRVSRLGSSANGIYHPESCTQKPISPSVSSANKTIDGIHGGSWNGWTSMETTVSSIFVITNNQEGLSVFSSLQLARVDDNEDTSTNCTENTKSGTDSCCSNRFLVLAISARADCA
jgi:hypothetical protein